MYLSTEESKYPCLIFPIRKTGVPIGYQSHRNMRRFTNESLVDVVNHSGPKERAPKGLIGRWNSICGLLVEIPI
jgi:hypothetical protein